MVGSQRERSVQRSRAGATVLEAEGNRRASLARQKKKTTKLDLDPTQLPFKRDKDAKAPEPLC